MEHIGKKDFKTVSETVSFHNASLFDAGITKAFEDTRNRASETGYVISSATSSFSSYVWNEGPFYVATFVFQLVSVEYLEKQQRMQQLHGMSLKK